MLYLVRLMRSVGLLPCRLVMLLMIMVRRRFIIMYRSYLGVVVARLTLCLCLVSWIY